MTTSDRRYTVSYEWCGHPSRRYVVRFLTKHLGSVETPEEAEKLVQTHAAERNAILTGSPP